MSSDPRYLKLKVGLSQLTTPQLQKILDYKDQMVFDDWNFDEESRKY